MTSSDRPSGWCEGQLRTLADLFAAVVEPAYAGESRRHADLAAEALTEVADPADLRQVRLTLSLLGSRLGAPLLAQRRSSDREAILRAWSTSPIPQRRTFFQLMKRLASFFAYADPGETGTNPRWADLGYIFVEGPVATTQPLERALVAVDRSQSAALELDADVVVVGSGAEGGVIAARLAEGGRDVLVVEAAKYLAEADLPRNEMDGFNELYLDRGLTATADLGIGILAGSAVGGGTLVNWTTSIDPTDQVRADWTKRHGPDGFAGADTDAHLARLNEEVTVMLMGSRVAEALIS